MPVPAEELLAAFLPRRVPGAALAVVRSGAPVFTHCHGMADLEWRQPVTPTTVFGLASLSKPFTALAILLLADDGLLDVAAPITEYLPDHPDRWHRITVAHLLTHTSGIPELVPRQGFDFRVDHTDAEIRMLLAGLPLRFEPGTRYGYTGSGYRLLDMIAAAVSGTKFANLVAERVFAPAGMVDSRVLTDDDVVPERASGYRHRDNGFANAPHVSATIPGGASGIGSTLADLLRFDAALRHGAFADASLHERMYTPVRLTGGATAAYGMGWRLCTYRGWRVKYHDGGVTGFSCIYLRVPERDTSIVLLTNLEPFECRATARWLMDRMLDPAVVSIC